MQRIFAELAIIENRSNKKALSKCSGLLISGGTDGTRTRDPCVTGRYSNRLNYRSTEFLRFITTGCHPGLLQFDAWQFPTLTWGDPTLPSALRRFTSEFGMGSGGTTALVPPGKFFVLVLCLLRSYCVGCSRECQSHTYVCSFHRVVCRLVSAQNPSDSESELKIFSNPPKHLRRCKVKPHGSLVPVSSTHRCAYTPGLSTSSSSTFLQET